MALADQLADGEEVGQPFRVRPVRYVAGAGIGLAVLSSFFPGTALAAGVLVLALAVTPAPGGRWGRGLAYATAGVTTLSLSPYGDTTDQRIAELRAAVDALETSGVG